MNMDRENNFLIKKCTGEIYQAKELKDKDGTESITIERLGDLNTKDIKRSRLDESYYVIDKKIDFSVWQTIYNFLKNEIESKEAFQFVYVYKSDSEMIQAVQLKELNDPVYLELEQAIENLAIQNFKKQSDNINTTKTTKKRTLIKKKKDNPVDQKPLSPSSEDDELQENDFIVVTPDPKIDSLDSIILHPKTKETIDQVLVQFELGDFFREEWSTNRVNKDQKSALNFFGPPGTGKTITAKSIANYFNKSILQVDYSMLISKYIGDTGKNIKKYFEKATKDDLILFLDEADALLQKRSNDSSNSSSSHNNQNQISFMQELDRFEGIIILTTNHFENYDAAQFRRFRHVEFFLPTQEMREKIIKDHIPEKVNLEKGLDFSKISKMTEGFSGGDIKNLIENVLKNFAMSVRKKNPKLSVNEIKDILRISSVSQENFNSEIQKIVESKKSFSKNKDIKRNKISLVS